MTLDVCTICSHVLMCTVFSRCCAMIVRRPVASYEIAQPSYDCNRVQMLTPASRQTIILKSYNLVRLSYDGRTMSYWFHTIIYVYVIVLTTSQAHLFQCDHKTKIVIS